jgi:hypothetical protein
VPAESGDQNLLGNYRQLIDVVCADTNYNPANADITKASPAIHFTASALTLDEVAAKSAPSKMATSVRQAAYEPLSGLLRRSFNMLKAAGVSKGVLDDAQTHVRKVTGTRKSPKPKVNPSTPETEDDKQHSASQMSFDNRRGNVAAYVAILANVPTYNPNEDELKVSSLQALVAISAPKTTPSAQPTPRSGKPAECGTECSI